MQPNIVTHDRLDLTERPGIDCSNDPGETRQEDKDATDLNKILMRGGVNPAWGKTEPVFGDTNYDWDLQTALAAADEAKRLINRLPQDVLTNYTNNEGLRLAALDGTLAKQVKEYLDKQKADAQLKQAQAKQSQGDNNEGNQRNQSSRNDSGTEDPEPARRRRENRAAQDDR